MVCLSYLVYCLAKQSRCSAACCTGSARRFSARFPASGQWSGHCQWPFARCQVNCPRGGASSDISVKLNAAGWNSSQLLRSARLPETTTTAWMSVRSAELQKGG